MPPKPAPWQNALDTHVQEYWLRPVILTQDCVPQLTPHEPQWLLLLRATQLLLQQYPALQEVPLATVRVQAWFSVRGTVLHVPDEQR